MAYSDTRSILEDLEEQVEYWRQRAEVAEQALRGDGWNKKVEPLTLQQTRIMRLLAKRDTLLSNIALLLADDYPNITSRAVMVRVSQIRSLLPEHISPKSIIGQCGAPYSIADRLALAEFLGGSNEH